MHMGFWTYTNSARGSDNNDSRHVGCDGLEKNVRRLLDVLSSRVLKDTGFYIEKSSSSAPSQDTHVLELVKMFANQKSFYRTGRKLELLAHRVVPSKG
jgi:hypothetical protein